MGVQAESNRNIDSVMIEPCEVYTDVNSVHIQRSVQALLEYDNVVRVWVDSIGCGRRYRSYKYASNFEVAPFSYASLGSKLYFL